MNYISIGLARCACVHHVAMLAIVELLAIRRHAGQVTPNQLAHMS